MSVMIRSFAKINLGLKIGAARPDGFHDLRTIYQTLALHDVVRVEVQPGSGIEVRCDDPRVPLDESNTCYKMAERLLATAGGSSGNEGSAIAGSGKIVIDIDKRLPVQGGMGAASSNAVATMLGLERALGLNLSSDEKMHLAAEVGSDVPLFLIGGTVLGIGRGEEVYPLPDLPAQHVVVITPAIGVSTPRAFAQWDALVTREIAESGAALTGADATGTINEFSHSIFTWLSESYFPQAGGPISRAVGLDGLKTQPASGVPAVGGDRAETPLLDLVRAGIENDFERVVFPEYPDLREVKRVLLREGALYASLSGSGSTLYGLFATADQAQAAAGRISAAGHGAVATTTLTREEYWNAVARS